MSLLRNTLVQTSLTLTSRILGFVRDILIAAKIGAGPIGDAFFTALMFPNLFRRILAEGAFTQAFVPVYARTLEEEGSEAARKVAEEALRGLFALAAAIIIIAEVTMPWIMLVVHGGYRNDAFHFNLAVTLTQITMPYLACMALTALLAGVLNSAGKFALSAVAPTFFNLSLITAALLSDSAIQSATYLAYAVVPAGIAQAGLLWWGVTRQKVRLGLGFPKFTPVVKRVTALAIPGVIAASGVQINFLISQALASFEESAKSWLYYAERIYQLPLGLVGVAVGTAILPRLARSVRGNEKGEQQDLLNEGIILAMAMVLPAAFALMFAPAFVIESLYGRGAFLASDAQRAGDALFHFAWGIPAFVLIKVLAPAFFAQEDTITPMKHSIASMVVNTILGASLFFWLRSNGVPGYTGLAIATSVAAWSNVALLSMTLIQRNIFHLNGFLISKLLRITIAAGSMLFALHGILIYLNSEYSIIVSGSIVELLVFVLTGMIIYAIATWITRAITVPELLKSLRK